MGKTVIDPIVDMDFHHIETALLPPGLYVVRLWDSPLLFLSPHPEK